MVPARKTDLIISKTLDNELASTLVRTGAKNINSIDLVGRSSGFRTTGSRFGTTAKSSPQLAEELFSTNSADFLRVSCVESRVYVFLGGYVASSFLERNGVECSGSKMLQVLQVRNANIKAESIAGYSVMSCYCFV